MTVPDRAGSAELPIHFFTIVLNGMPFIEHHVELFRQLPFEWHWHVIEGVAEHKHDTAWSLQRGGRITDELHEQGRSNDGTSEYLDAIAAEEPRVSLYRKPLGEFWDGKREMVNAPIPEISERCLLWQIDADEIWTVEQVVSAHRMFRDMPAVTAAYYICEFYVGPDLVTTTLDTYGNKRGYEWLRTWRFEPGCTWLAHEPPRLAKPVPGSQFRDLAEINPAKHDLTSTRGLVFRHYAYATPESVRFKEVYYGYEGAVDRWRALQRVEETPTALKDHFGWVNDGTMVERTGNLGLRPLAGPDANGTWHFGTHEPTRVDPATILIVRTDAIGDNVLFSSVLPHLDELYPDARIVMACQEHVGNLYEACPHIDEVVTFDKKAIAASTEHGQVVVERLQSIGAELAINPVFSREEMTDILTLWSGARWRIAMEGDLSNIYAKARKRNDLMYPELIPNAPGRATELARHTELLAGFGVDAPDLQPLVWTSDEDEAYADGVFAEHDLDPERTLAVFPGAMGIRRIYPHLAEALEPFAEYDILVLGGEAEIELGASIVEAFPGHGASVAGDTTLRQTAALMRRCRLFVGTESSGMHIACAVGLPNVVVLGGGHFGRFAPYSPLTTTVSVPLDCYGCRFDCPYTRVHCIVDIPPAAVSAAVADALAQPRDAGREKPRVFIEAALSTDIPNGNPAYQDQTGMLLCPADVEFVER